MTITPTASGLDHLIVSAFLEGIKAGHISCQYSGTMRWRDANLPRDFFLNCLDGWLILYPDHNHDEDYEVDGMVGDTDKHDVLAWLLNDGSVTLDDRNNAFVNLSSGLKRLGFDFTSQSNIPGGGLIMYGVNGIGAVMTESDSTPLPIESTLAAYLSQFPNLRVQGNDVALILPASNTLLQRMLFSDPTSHIRYMNYIAEFRAVLPPVTTP